MKTTTNRLVSLVALFLSLTLAFSITSPLYKTQEDTVTPVVRTYEMETQENANLSRFSSYEIIEDEEFPAFNGTVLCSSKEASECFDNVSLNNTDDEVSLVFSCFFDMNLLQFQMKILAYDEDGALLEEEETTTDAFVTEFGGLDAYIEIDGEQYLLSNLHQEGIDECGLFSKVAALVVVVVYVVVAETAEQIKARSNYEYNKQLEEMKKGVERGVYVTNQDYSQATKSKWNEKHGNNYPANYYPGDYKFGFTYFCDVGCEVASVYNLMIALDRAEMLSETIFNFEKWSIEVGTAWGCFGSNPQEIYRYLYKKNISYKKYTSLASFKTALAGKKNCKIIMSTWNNGSALNSISTLNGLHTYFITKDASLKNPFYSYNYGYSYKSIPYESIDKISANAGGAFICAYIID